MDILLTILLTTAINLAIIAIVINKLENLLLDNFKTQDKFNDTIAEHICDIYDIIQFNGLTRPAKKRRKRGKVRWIYKSYQKK